MLTPKQQQLLARLADVLKPLGAEPDKPSIEYRTNVAISARVDQWLTDLQNSPAKRRTVLSPADGRPDQIVDPGACIAAVARSPFWLPSDHLAALEREHGPKSTWKYPLNWTPW